MFGTIKRASSNVMFGTIKNLLMFSTIKSLLCRAIWQSDGTTPKTNNATSITTAPYSSNTSSSYTSSGSTTTFDSSSDISSILDNN